MNTLIRLLYAILIAAAVVTFVGVGIYTFYPAPKMPDYQPTPMLEKGIAVPVPADGSGPSTQPSKDYERSYTTYQADLNVYQRNSSIILVAVGAAVVAFGLWFSKRSDVIGEGLALGGVGTSIYAVGLAIAADDRIMRFVAVTVFLGSAIVLVYFKFNESAAAKKPAAKSA